MHTEIGWFIRVGAAAATVAIITDGLLLLIKTGQVQFGWGWRRSGSARDTRSLLDFAPFFIQIKAKLFQFSIIPRQFLLSTFELLKLILIRRDFLAHYGRRITTETLPLSGKLPSFLAIIIQETAKISELLIIFLKPLI
jgi:hypothetical protein